MINLFYLLST